MQKISLRYQLLIGFAFVVLLLAVSISSTLLLVKSTKENTNRIVHLRVPTALASSDMSKNIYASLAALRSWMLTGKVNFKVQRAQVWEDIDRTSAKMDELSKNWTNPDNVNRWSDFKEILHQFSAAQDKVEGIANSPNQRPATNILLTEAAPHAAIMAQQITSMIDHELNELLTVKEDHTQLLGMMADVRGSLGLAIASIRAYLLTGEKRFINEYNISWERNNSQLENLSNSAAYLSSRQETEFNKFKKSHAAFAPLPPKMFAIRASEKWDMANYLLITEAVPRADSLLKLLLGDIHEDGSVIQGMVDNQRDLLEADATTEAGLVNKLYNFQWLLLIIGVLFGTGFAVFASQAFTKPILSLAAAMLRLAKGELDIKIPNQNRNDEIGEMAKAVDIFKENAIERNRIEEERKETRRELDFQKFALDEHAIVSVTDVRGVIIYANNKFCEVSGYSKEELLGKNHRIVKSDEHTASFFTDLWETIAGGNVWHGEVKNKAKDGHGYWVMTTIVPTLNANGKPFQYVSIRTDVTDRKEAEMKALTASRTKSDLMANMSHELRTPLNAIIGFSGFMREEMFGPVGSDKNCEYINDIHDSGQHLLGLINDILDVSAIGADALELREENVSLPDVIDAAVRLIMLRAKGGQITVTSSIDANIPQIYADERRVKQIMLNLLSNAVKFTPPGGEVSINSQLNADGSLSFIISDTGIGMNKEEAEIALSSFGQVDSGLDRKHEGTGLGLPLTKGLMELHGGTLEIKSEKGSGTQISVTFPKERVIKDT